MKRVLCLAVVAGAAFVSVPADATTGPVPGVIIWSDSHRTGVGTGIPGQPLLSVYVDHDAHEACAGFSYQIPVCVPVRSS
jgi:hypothetical protein